MITYLETLVVRSAEFVEQLVLDLLATKQPTHQTRLTGHGFTAYTPKRGRKKKDKRKRRRA